MSSENLMEKVNALGERLKIGGVEMGRKVSAGMSSVGFKVKEFFQEPNNQADKLVDDATSEALIDGPNWAIILHLCDLVNAEKLNTCEVVRAVKRRIMMMKSSNPRSQYLALVLLEALVKNCHKAFFEVATERVLDEMVKLIEDPLTVVTNRDKALVMLQAWGESTTELRYLPVYEQTYKSLKSRGIRFPARDNESLAPISTPPRSSNDPETDISLEHLLQQDIDPVPSFTPEQTKEAFDVARNTIELLSTVLSSSPQQDVLKDDLTITLVQQCRESQSTVHRIVETTTEDNNEALLFEAFHVNDEIQKVLSKYEELKKKKKKPTVFPLEPEPVMIPAAIIEPDDESPRFTEEANLIRKPGGSSRVGLSHDDMMDDLDEMIFGKKGTGDTSQRRQDTKKLQSSKERDLISS